MKKVIRRISVIVFIIGVCGIICGFAAVKRVKPLVKQVAIEMAVSNNIIKFVEENMTLLGIKEEIIRDTVNNMEFIDNVVEYYVDAAMLGIKNSSHKKIDIAPYLDKDGVSGELSGIIKKIVYAVIEVVDAKPDMKDKLIINSVISFGASKIVDLITKEINSNLVEINLKIRLEVRMYYLLQNKAARVILVVITAVSLLLSLILTDKDRYLIKIGRMITLAGASSLIVLTYNIIRCSYKIKKFIGFVIPLGLNNYMIAGATVFAAGLLIMLPGILRKKGESN